MKRSSMMTVLGAIAVTLAARLASASDRPNVVVLVSDDHRADVLGCAGHPVVRTPNLDRLAAEGVRFENAFVTTSICAASRATILTGLVERTHGFTFGTPPLARALCERSYPARLREHGYRTGFVGKLGISVEGGRETLAGMFDLLVPLGRTPYVKTRADGSTRHLTDLTGDAAIAFIRTAPQGTPFCLSVSFNAAPAEDGDKDDHYPPPPHEAGLYEGVTMPRPRLDGGAAFETQPSYLKESLNRDRYFWRWDTPEKYDRNLRNYFRMLSGLDRNVGRIMAELERRGIVDDTVVIFIGDNGYYMGERGFAGKWSHYEQSLRVPLIVRDPRVPPARRNRVVAKTALNTDVAPTVLAAAGVASEPRMQGVSLLPFAAGEAGPEREGFYCEHRMTHDRLPRWEGYRTSRFKYARYLDAVEDAELLHDLQRDPDELTNLAADPAHAAVLGRMRAETTRRSAQYAAASTPLPRVLLLGDSISMGYHDTVVAALADEAVVVRPKENCAGTTKGRMKIDEWLALDGGGFDVIHFNFGLHDLKRVGADGRNSRDPADGRQAELDAYERNLRAIVAELEATGATLIFATTTPVPPGGVRPHRDVDDPVRYNAVARAIMMEHGIAIDDLYGFALPRMAELQPRVDVHFTKEGSQQLGEVVATHLRAVLRQVD
jgi:arylsulfatase A-like enzyme